MLGQGTLFLSSFVTTLRRRWRFKSRVWRTWAKQFQVQSVMRSAGDQDSWGLGRLSALAGTGDTDIGIELTNNVWMYWERWEFTNRIWGIHGFFHWVYLRSPSGWRNAIKIWFRMISPVSGMTGLRCFGMFSHWLAGGLRCFGKKRATFPLAIMHVHSWGQIPSRN